MHVSSNRPVSEDEKADDVCSRRHLYCDTPVVTSWAVAGQQVVFLHMYLQTRVTLEAFPVATPRGRSSSSHEGEHLSWKRYSVSVRRPPYNIFYKTVYWSCLVSWHCCSNEIWSFVIKLLFLQYSASFLQYVMGLTLWWSVVHCGRFYFSLWTMVTMRSIMQGQDINRNILLRER